MIRLVAEGYFLLLRCEFLIASGKTTPLRRIVEAQRANASRVGYSIQTISHAMDLACVFYPKSVFCLQRSAATILLLRRRGIPAELVIGAQLLPFRSHAWVELNGVVINDKPYMHDIYQVLERW